MTAATKPLVRRISVAHLVLIVPWIALVRDAWQPIGDTSFLWHIRAGELQQIAGSVINSEPFSFTKLAEPWRTQSWLVELLYSWAEDLSGLDFVPPMILIVSTVAFVTIGLTAYRWSGRSVPATAFVMVLTTFLLISFMVPRPVLFSYLLFAVLVLVWDRPETRWAAPFVVWIWAAAHGSFPLGLAYIGLSIAMKREWKWTPAVLVAGGLTLLTAHGLGVFEILVSFVGNSDALEFITEWRKPTLSSPIFIPFVGGVVFVVIGALRGLVRPRHVWLLLPFMLLAATAIRSVPPAWIAIVPLVALSLHGMSIGTKRGFRPGPAVIFTVAVAVIPFLVKPDGGLVEDRLPVAALPHLDNVKTFHDDRAGGFLIWAEGPDRLVYFDDRAELYGERVREFVEVREGDTPWQPVFERDGIVQVLLMTEEPLIEDLVAADWTITYQDEAYVVLRS